MEFRKTVKEDIPEVMRIINQAQEYFKEKGIDQWQDNYPNSEVISNDIDNNYSHVLIKDGNIVATVAIILGVDESYNKIYHGKWLSNGEYGVIHRIAVDNDVKGMGLAHEVIKYTENLCSKNNIHSIKIDTHKENMAMQNLLKKSGFEYCGIIYLDRSNDVERVAFEKVF